MKLNKMKARFLKKLWQIRIRKATALRGRYQAILQFSNFSQRIRYKSAISQWIFKN